MHYRSEKDRKVVSKEVGIGREGKKRRGRGTEESSRLTNVGDNGVSSIHDHDCRIERVKCGGGKEEEGTEEGEGHENDFSVRDSEKSGLKRASPQFLPTHSGSVSDPFYRILTHFAHSGSHPHSSQSRTRLTRLSRIYSHLVNLTSLTSTRTKLRKCSGRDKCYR